jgi:pyridoxal phosphate enzyme (YggS family)
MQATISENLSDILTQISTAAKNVDRSKDTVSLIAVSKKQSPELMNEYHLVAKEAGIPVCFGENYVQEYKAKLPLLTPGYEVHLIGPLQSNKVREAVKLFDLIQSVHSLKIVELVVKEATRANKKQRILLQINISSDDQKSGFTPAELSEVLAKYKDAPSIKIEGCMTITALYNDAEQIRADFRSLTTLVNEVFTQQHGIHNPTISMGMSSDFGAAIEEGSTMVRIGTALFGERL